MNKKLLSILEHMDEMSKPHRVMQEQIERMLEPQRRFQEQMNRYLEPHHRFQEKMDKYLQPYKKLQEQMHKYLEPQRLLGDHMRQYLELYQGMQEKYLEPQRALQAQMEKYLEPYRTLQEQMSKYAEPYRALHEQLGRQLEPHQLIQEQLEKYLKPLSQYLSDPMMESVSINADGSLSIAGELADVHEIEQSIESLNRYYPSAEEFLDDFFRALESLGKAARIIIMVLVLPYFLAIVANLTTSIYEGWWNEYVRSDHRVAKREIIREANGLYRSEELKDYRFVYVSILQVRATGNIKADIVDELHLGKTVRVLVRNRRWSYIEYVDSGSDEKRNGWVFSRYLERFSK